MTAPQQPELRSSLDYPYRSTKAGTFFLVTTITAPTADSNPAAARPPLNLSFVVDRSGSMSGGTLDLARQGVEYAISLLNKRDTVSLVVYDNQVDLLLSQRNANREARAKAIRRLRRIRPRGSTALADGWMTGCGQLATIADAAGGAICRTILLTDGLANVGETNPVALSKHAGELANRGVSTTTFGVGGHFDEVLLANMADAGRGRYHYIADSASIVPVFAGELGEMIHVTMRDVSVGLALPATWNARPFNDLPLRTGADGPEVDLGEISSGDTRSIVWEVEAPASAEGSIGEISLSLRWTAPDGNQTSTINAHQVVEARQDRGTPDPDAQDRIATMLSARAQAEALEHNRAGRFDRATQVVQAARAAMPQSAEGMRQLQELDGLSADVAAPMAAAQLKDHHFRSRRASRAQRDYSRNE